MFDRIFKNFFSYECICCGGAVEKSDALFCEWCEEELYRDKPRNDDGIISALNYSSVPVKSLVLTMKDYKIKEVYRFAAKLVADEIRAKNIPDLNTYSIVFAPRNIKSLFKKGFDQSYEIGKYLSLELFGTKRKFKIIFRGSIFSKEQKMLNFQERRENVRENLKLLPFVKVSENVIIFDDVTTTGSTLFVMRELAIQSGAKRCLLCTVARQTVPSEKYKRC